MRKIIAYLFVFVTLLVLGCGDGAEGPARKGQGALQHSIEAQSCSISEAQHQISSEENPLRQSTVREAEREAEPLLYNVRNRNVTPLNGEWRYIVDQLNVGDNSVLLRGGVGENEKYGPREILEYAFSDNYTLRVPGDWNTQDESLFWYRGVIWYQKEFASNATPGKRVHLYFGGANFSKDVYVNGKLLMRHEGGFTPFNVEVTDYMQAGSNSVVVKVNNVSGPSKVPTEYNDWKNYGGITREVMLVETPEAFIRNYKLQLNPENAGQVRGWVDVEGASRGEKVIISIPEADIRQEFKIDGDQLAVEFNADLQKWSPDNPKLYDVKVELASGDSLDDAIGFRTIAVEGENLLLNGKPVFLRGISMHEESLLTSGRAWSAEDATATIKLLQDLNANYVRLAHYPHNEQMVRAAERAGIMVWAELPVYHDVQFANPCTIASAKRQFSELIARDQNRSAVILWSLGNETPVSDDRNRFFQSLAKHVRDADNTRPLAAALLTAEAMEKVGLHLAKLLFSEKSKVLNFVLNPDPVIMQIDDPLGEVVDVIGVNVYLGWYLAGPFTQELKNRGLDVEEGEVRRLVLEAINEFSMVTPFSKPIIISEVGAGAKQGMHGDKLDAWTEELQANIYKSELSFIENIPAVRGISPWILKDFRSPYRINTLVQDYWNRKGLVSETGEKKMAFEVLSQYYGKLAEKPAADNADNP
jgi:beta-glucuronidase